MAQYRLKETHPTVEKIRKLEQLADELGITIRSGYGGQLLVSDRDNPQEVQYRDVEQGIFSYDVTCDFPHIAETKLIFEKED